jgi:hypothetical protein
MHSEYEARNKRRVLPIDVAKEVSPEPILKVGGWFCAFCCIPQSYFRGLNANAVVGVPHNSSCTYVRMVGWVVFCLHLVRDTPTKLTLYIHTYIYVSMHTHAHTRTYTYIRVCIKTRRLPMHSWNVRAQRIRVYTSI